jgi:hypothetical protein
MPRIHSSKTSSDSAGQICSWAEGDTQFLVFPSHNSPTRFSARWYGAVDRQSAHGQGSLFPEVLLSGERTFFFFGGRT